MPRPPRRTYSRSTSVAHHAMAHRTHPPGRRAYAASTIQSAYRNRRKFRKNLQPFVETKAVETSRRGANEDFLSRTSAFNIFTPDCFLYKKQGMTDQDMLGDNIYSRYLNTKILMKFPQDENQILIPTQIWIYQVWITTPYALTKFTSPGRTDASNAQLEAHILAQAKEFYDTKEDRLDFAERLSGVQVLKKFKVKPQRQTSIGLPSQSNMYNNTGRAAYTHLSGTNTAVPAITTGKELEMIGGPPDYFKTMSWPCKVKMQYQVSGNLTTLGGEATHYLNMPPKSIGYPAWIVFNPDYEGQTSDAHRIIVQHASKHYYGDQ
jgi:hypothetical protein